MRTVRARKEICRIYSFASPNDIWTRITKETIEKVRKAVIEEGAIDGPFSDIVETIYYAEVEEQVPDVYELWYFVCVKGEEKSFLCFDCNKEALTESRTRRIVTGHRCSEIKLLREEF